MAIIVFFCILFAAGSFAQQNEDCQDVLGHCSVVKANCKSRRAETQMRKLCAKTCGFCVEKPVTTVAPKVTTVKPKEAKPDVFSLEIFLLYLKNDIKFLKEEIVDVKFRLRNLATRQPVNQVIQVKDDDEDGYEDEMIELRDQTQRLSKRIQDQTDRFAKLASNFSINLADVRNNFSDEISKIQRDLKELSGDMEQNSDKLYELSKIDGKLQNFTQNINGVNRNSRVDTAAFSHYVRNLSSTVADQFLKLQEQFSKVFNEQQVKFFDLSQNLENVTASLQKERTRSNRMEKFIEAFSSINFGRIIQEDRRKIEVLTGKLDNVTRTLRTQNIRTSMLTALVDELSKKPSGGQFEEERAQIFQLQSKFNYVMRRLEVQIRKTNALQIQLNNTRTVTVATPAAPIVNSIQRSLINEMSKRIISLDKQLQELKAAAKSGISDSVQKLVKDAETQQQGSVGAVVSPQNLQAVAKLSADLVALSKEVEADAVKIIRLENRIDEVNANSTSGVEEIKENIEQMAKLRNNDTFTVAEITSKYQQGIMSLLGPQQANSTRFFNPRFDWENGRLSIYGYIAIHREGDWGTICDDSFDEKEAEVLCRMGGYQGGAYDDGKYKIGDGNINGKSRTDYRIWIDELRCDGTELSIEDCRHGSEGWGIHDCDHGEDIGIKCYIS